MIWNQLRGHRAQIEMLRRSLGRGRLAHAYLFAGTVGTGKSLFARLFAMCLLCERHSDEELDACGECSNCRQMLAQSHPDFFWVQRPEGKSEIPVDVFLGKADERGKSGLIHDLYLHPMAGDRRIALLDDANYMNDEGANAMLKTLEEPPPHSILILIAENLDGLLPTIRSRCQLVRFSPLVTQDVADLLIKGEITSSVEEANAAAAMSDGSLEMATQLLNEGLRTIRMQLFQSLAASDMNAVTTSKQILEGIEGLSTQTAEQKNYLGWLVRFTQEFYRQTLLELANPNTAGQGMGPGFRSYCDRLRALGLTGTELAMELFERAVEAEEHLAGNVSGTRMIEVLLDDLGRVSRKRRKQS